MILGERHIPGDEAYRRAHAEVPQVRGHRRQRAGGARRCLCRRRRRRRRGVQGRAPGACGLWWRHLLTRPRLRPLPTRRAPLLDDLAAIIAQVALAAALEEKRAPPTLHTPTTDTCVAAPARGTTTCARASPAVAIMEAQAGIRSFARQPRWCAPSTMTASSLWGVGVGRGERGARAHRHAASACMSATHHQAAARRPTVTTATPPRAPPAPRRRAAAAASRAATSARSPSSAGRCSGSARTRAAASTLT